MLKQAGLILFSTLMIIIVITLLLLSQMQQILLLTKALDQQNQRGMILTEMDELAKQLIKDKKILKLRECIIDKKDTKPFIQIINKKNCKVKNNDKYQYVIEDLGLFDCLVIQNHFGYTASYHRRYTLQYNHPKGDKIYLQIRSIEATSLVENCTKEKLIIKAGLTSWNFGTIEKLKNRTG